MNKQTFKKLSKIILLPNVGYDEYSILYDALWEIQRKELVK